MEVQNDMQLQLDTLCSALQGSRCVVIVLGDKKLEINGHGEDFSLWEETSQNNVEGGFSLKTIKSLFGNALKGCFYFQITKIRQKYVRCPKNRKY